MRVRVLLAVLAVAAAVSFLSGGRAAPEKATGAEPKNVAELMRKKLEHAHKVLEGIALNDFDKIADHADGLIQVSKEVEWRVLKTPRYDVQSNDFRRAVENLLEKANQKNLDGAALGYLDLTLTCVKCHKYVREARMTRLEDGRRPSF